MSSLSEMCQNVKDKGQTIYPSTNTLLSVTNMDTSHFLIYFQLVLSVCYAAYIHHDGKLNMLHSREKVVPKRETKHHHTRALEKHLFPMKSFNNCKENTDKSLLGGFLGGLLPSVLSGFHKNHNTQSSDSGSSDDMCGGSKKLANAGHDSFRTSNEGGHIQQLESLGDTGKTDFVRVLDSNNHDAKEKYEDHSRESKEPNHSLTDIVPDVHDLSNQLLSDDTVANLPKLLEKDIKDDTTNIEDNKLLGIEHDDIKSSHDLKSCESCKDNIGDKDNDNQGALLDADICILNSDEEKCSSNEDSTESDTTQNPVLDVDIDALNGEENVLFDSLGGILSHSEKDHAKLIETERSKIEMVSFDQNARNDNNGRPTLDKGNQHDSGSSFAAQKNTYESFQFKLSDKDDKKHNSKNKLEVDSNKNQNEKNLLEDVTLDNINIEMYVKNNKNEGQDLDYNAIENINQNSLEKVNPSQDMTNTNEENYFVRDNQQDDYLNSNTKRIFKQISPLMNTNQKFTRSYAISKIPLSNLFHQAGMMYTDALPIIKFGNLQFPLVPQIPESVAGSSLYGSYASAQTRPLSGFGGLGAPGTSTSVEGVETSVQEVQTSVQGVETSQEEVIEDPLIPL